MFLRDIRFQRFIGLVGATGLVHACYAGTGQPHRRIGLAILKWTLVAAFGFFAVLAVERLARGSFGRGLCPRLGRW